MVKIPKFAQAPVWLKVSACAVAISIAGGTYGFLRLSRYVDAKLHDGALGTATLFYSAPRLLEVGDQVSLESIANELRVAGYTEGTANNIGSYTLASDAMTITPGHDSYFRSEPVQIRVHEGVVTTLASISSHQEVEAYALEPQPLAAMDEGVMQRCRPVQFPHIPKHVINALLSAEDKHFFSHVGFDPLRLAKAAWVDLRRGRKEQGGSTLTMQLARNLYLDSGKNWKRKVNELLIAEMLEWKLPKTQIFEDYVNQVYLGRRDTIAIRGFGQAANTFFGKELRDMTLSQSALLAGLVQRPSFFDPVRHPERAVSRRNLVLTLMAQNGYITQAERTEAIAEPLQVAAPSASSTGAPWFVDFAVDELQLHDQEEGQARVYTTLDPDLQRAAVEAVRQGMIGVDVRLKQSIGHLPAAQVALVAIDSHTGEVKAVVGGREFGRSQLNHAKAMRQPGSVFKPFVYAAALSSDREGRKFTPATTVVDEPTSFRFDGHSYTPSNFNEHFYGRVTLRRALAKSMNVATVSVAEKVGYDRVLRLARSAGLNDRMRSTPAIALGAYEATPLEMAASYTAFANSGMFVEPSFVAEVRTPDGAVRYHAEPATHKVLDAPVAFVMQDMLSEVLRSGTAAGVRASGFNVPAAGKTGTSRDGWFIGYTSNLICAVWVGFDDNRDLDLEGAKSALPIWTEFMRRASRRAAYRKELGVMPAGVVSVSVDAYTGLLAGPSCESTRREYFVHGTEPHTVCSHEVPDAAGEFGNPVFTISYPPEMAKE